MKNRKKKRKAKKTYNRVVTLFMLMAITLNIVVVAVANYVYTQGIIESYSRICSGVTQVVSYSVQGSIVEDMFNGEAMKDYEFVKNQVRLTVDQTPDLERVYIYDMKRDGMYLLVDSDKPDSPIGEKVEYPERLESLIDTFYEGKNPPNFTTGDIGSQMMTSLVPIYDLRGNCVCYVGCDMDISSAYTNIKDFTIQLATIVSVPTIIVAFVASLLIRNKVLAPIHQLDSYLKKYQQEHN